MGVRAGRAAALVAVLGLAGGLLGAPAPHQHAGGAADTLAGPVPAEVVAVLDGDTLEVRAHVWLGHEVRARVRLAGIDAPELKGRCARERDLAARARAFLTRRLAPASGSGTPNQVLLRDIRYGKYAGRVLARVETVQGEDLSRRLIAAGLARPYAGGGRASWCAAAG